MLEGRGEQEPIRTLDRETFEAVWGRVCPAGEGPVQVAPAPQALAAIPASETASARLQGLTADCLADAAVYRALARQGRAAGTLERLGKVKTGHARRLSAAYFLRSGVRYWPIGTVIKPDPRGLFFPALRRQFLDEERRADQLEALGQSGGGELAGLCAQLARETRTLAREVWRVVEKET